MKTRFVHCFILSFFKELKFLKSISVESKHIATKKFFAPVKRKGLISLTPNALRNTEMPEMIAVPKTKPMPFFIKNFKRQDIYIVFDNGNNYENKESIVFWKSFYSY